MRELAELKARVADLEPELGDLKNQLAEALAHVAAATDEATQMAAEKARLGEQLATQEEQASEDLAAVHQKWENALLAAEAAAAMQLREAEALHVGCSDALDLARAEATQAQSAADAAQVSSDDLAKRYKKAVKHQVFGLFLKLSLQVYLIRKIVPRRASLTCWCRRKPD